MEASQSLAFRQDASLSRSLDVTRPPSGLLDSMAPTAPPREPAEDEQAVSKNGETKRPKEDREEREDKDRGKKTDDKDAKKRDDNKERDARKEERERESSTEKVNSGEKTKDKDNKDDEKEKDETEEEKSPTMFEKICYKMNINPNLVMLKVTLFMMYGGEIAQQPRCASLLYFDCVLVDAECDF